MNRTLLGIDRKMGTFPDSVKATRRLPDLHGRIGNRSGLCAVPTACLKERSRPRARPDLIIIIDELDRTAEQPAFGIGILLPDLLGEQSGPAVGAEPARQRHAVAE